MNLPSYPPPDTEVARAFWEGVERGELRLPRCSVCGRFEWYPSDAGPECAGGHYDWTVVAGSGTLFTWTRVERRFLPEGGEPPYLVGLVELDETDGVRLIANLDSSGRDPVVNERVRIRFDGEPGRRRPVFVPLEPGEH